jgi:hypothetical protein
MKKIIAGFILPMLIIGFTGLTSCKDRSSIKQKEITEKQQEKTLETKIEENVYPLPTSAEVIKMLTELEVGFRIGITNPVENTKKYFSSTSRAINLGAYGADLSYVTLYNMQQQVIDYLDGIRLLANELNMGKVYDEALYGKIKENYDNRDELVKILTGAFEDTYSFLRENDQETLAILVVGGAWIEGMYLTCNVSEAAYNVAGISKVLLEQKESFDLLLEISQPYATDASVGDFLKMLDPVKKVYEGLTTSLTEKDIKNISTAITGVREKIVQ